jgi:uncharacterized protein YdeI (YjbR/CyaY-like superfamily)
VSPSPQPHDVHYFASPGELRAWFDDHHETADELWVGYWKRATGTPTLTWSEAVDEALCVGWIDGVRKRIDDERHAQRFTPRRKGSIWSAINVDKVRQLEAAGRMTAAGRAAFEARTDERTAVYSYERPEARFTDDETAAFQARNDAWADWDRRPPSYRKAVTYWVTSAKRPETRARRLQQLIEASEARERVGPMRTASDR